MSRSHPPCLLDAKFCCILLKESHLFDNSVQWIQEHIDRSIYQFHLYRFHHFDKDLQNSHWYLMEIIHIITMYWQYNYKQSQAHDIVWVLIGRRKWSFRQGRAELQWMTEWASHPRLRAYTPMRDLSAPGYKLFMWRIATPRVSWFQSPSHTLFRSL